MKEEGVRYTYRMTKLDYLEGMLRSSYPGDYDCREVIYAAVKAATPWHVKYADKPCKILEAVVRRVIDMHTGVSRALPVGTENLAENITLFIALWLNHNPGVFQEEQDETSNCLR